METSASALSGAAAIVLLPVFLPPHTHRSAEKQSKPQKQNRCEQGEYESGHHSTNANDKQEQSRVRQPVMRANGLSLV